eukprot:5670170-Lingulodinium_polyedra.AAC.1
MSRGGRQATARAELVAVGSPPRAPDVRRGPLQAERPARPAPAGLSLKATADRIRQHRSWRAVLEDREIKTTVLRHLRWARAVFEASRSDSAAEKPDACAI